jgi:hypothetical protein
VTAPRGEGREYTRYQQKIIRRYYQTEETRLRQRLPELVSELYLAEGKKRERLWQQVAELLTKLGLSAQRVEHLCQQGKPELLAAVIKELETRPS